MIFAADTIRYPNPLYHALDRGSCALVREDDGNRGFLDVARRRAGGLKPRLGGPPRSHNANNPWNVWCGVSGIMVAVFAMTARPWEGRITSMTEQISWFRSLAEQVR